MQKIKKKALAFFMAFTMLIGSLVPAYAAKAAEPEEIPQSVMAGDCSATSFKDPEAWGDGGPELAFDGNADTAWHTAYDADLAQTTYSIEFGLGAAYKVAKLSLQGKAGGNNGYIKEADVFASLDGGTTWRLVKTISFESKEDAKLVQEIDLEDTEANRIKITVKDSYNETSNKLVNIGEIHVWQSGKADGIDYREKNTWTFHVNFNDSRNKAGVRPESCSVQLMDEANNQYIQTLTANGALKDSSTIEIPSVPRYIATDGGYKEAVYEVSATAYAGSGYTKEIVQTGEREYTVTYTLAMENVSKTVSVEWINGDADKRPEIQVQLFKQEREGGAFVNVGNLVTLNAGNNWSYTWKELPSLSGTVYGVREIAAAEGYETSYSGEKIEVSGNKGVLFDAQGTLKITNTGAVHQHTWVEGEITKKPSCQSEGERTDTCSCGETKKVVLEKTAHTWDGGKVTTEPTAEKEGVRTYTCTVCKEVRTEKIDKLEPEKPEEPGKPEEPEKPVKPVKVKFVDIVKGRYDYEPIVWAYENGITNGVDETHFAPESAATRADMITFLWRANGSLKASNAKNPFKDIAEGAYYYDAVLWAYENGITLGTDQTHFSPDQTITRAESVTFIYRMNGSPEVKKASTFKDLDKSGYYYAAVLWAAENGIVRGYNAETFAPEDQCVRGQVVTMLYNEAHNR